MAAPDLAAADPVAVVLAWLKDHPVTTEVLGGPEHVSGILRAPWPHLQVTEGAGGDLRGLVWDAEYEVSFELYGSPEGHPGKAAMRAQAVRLLRAVLDLPEEQQIDPGVPVVSDARPSGVFAYTPTTVGQPRWTFGAFVTLRPPTL